MKLLGLSEQEQKASGEEKITKELYVTVRNDWNIMKMKVVGS